MKRARVSTSTADLQGLLERNGAKSRPLNLPFILIGSDKLRQKCIATNVSLSGILLRANSMSVNVGEIVELEFKLNFSGFLMRCSMLTKLAGFSEHGVVIDFYQYNSEIFRYIYKLMYDSCLRETAPDFESAAFDHQDGRYADQQLKSSLA